MTQPVPTTPAPPPAQTDLPVRDAAGNLGTVPADQYRAAIASGNFTPAAQADIDAAHAKAARAEKYTTLPQKTAAFVESAGNTLMAPLGLVGANYTDLIRMGLPPERQAQIAEDIKARAEENPYTSAAGSLTTTLAMAPVFGAAGGAAESLAARGLTGLGAGAKGAGLLSRTAGYVLPKVASEATQGALMGGQQYLADAALGDHDLRAQELVAAMGGGALIGGGLGLGTGLLGAGGREIVGLGKRLTGAGVEGPPALGKALLSRGKGMVGKIDEVAQPLIDRMKPQFEEAANTFAERGTGGMMRELDAFDKLPPVTRARADEMLLKDIPERAGVKAVERPQQRTIAREIRKEAEKSIRGPLREFDALEPNVVNVAELAKHVRSLDAEFAEAGMESERKVLYKYADSLEKNYGRFTADGQLIEARTSLERIHKARARLDDEIFDLGQQKKGTKIAPMRRIRDVMEDQIESEADRIAATIANDSPLHGAYQKGKIDYAAAKTIERATDRGVKGLRSNRILGPGEHAGAALGGFMGSMVAGPWGALAGYGAGAVAGRLIKTRGDQAMAQVAHQLSKGATISEVASMTASEITKGVRRALGSDVGATAKMGYENVKGLLEPAAETIKTGTVKTVRTAGRLASTGASAGATLGKIEMIRALTAPKFSQIRTDLNERKNDPTIIATEVLGTGIQETHPAIAKSLVETAQRANDYLWSKLPPEVIRPSMGGPKSMLPTADQLREFAKHIKAVDDPLSILDDLYKSDVSPATVKTLKAVYPKLYSEVETEVRLAVVGNDKISYDKKISIGIMFGQPVDPTLTPEYMQAMSFAASSAVPQRGSGRGTRSAGSSVDSLIKTISPPPARALRPTISLATRAQKLSSR